MSDAAANRTLDLACTVGSVADAIEALEDGADINFGGGAPLFSAIFNRNVEVIRMLIERDADLSAFIPPAKRGALTSTDAIIEILMACAPPDPKAIDPGIMGELDATIRKGGLGKPVLEGDWDGMVNYVEKLEKIGAPELSACVAEFVEMFLDAKAWGDAILFEAVKKGKKKIAPLTERYLAVEIDSVEELARAFLDRESGKVAEASESETPVDEADAAEPTEDADSDDPDGELTAIAS